MSLSLNDDAYELLDPTPDVHSLFLQFNDMFFGGKLAGIEVKWSPRMTLCAGVCSFDGVFCSIRLSAPLLRLRPRSDLVNTLLHEMIHAFLFVSSGTRDRDAHGPNFCDHMSRINERAGTSISIYHTFVDEVDLFRVHWWRCDGPCQHRPPYHGMVKRAQNRPPGPRDPWWARHQAECGGTYVKVREPTSAETAMIGKLTAPPAASDAPKAVPPKGSVRIDDAFRKAAKRAGVDEATRGGGSQSDTCKQGQSGTLKQDGTAVDEPRQASASSKRPRQATLSPPASATDARSTAAGGLYWDLTACADDSRAAGHPASAASAASAEDDLADMFVAIARHEARRTGRADANADVDSDDDVIVVEPPPATVECPGCGTRVPQAAINTHLDRCLT
eukprot:m.254747 g.254747  ORF g.254747 m.254747 type:complete len:390 (+) comp19118_c0_seq1:43-1212(+)